MITIYVIGGMGAGKSTATHALESLGLPSIDLDRVAHDVLEDEATQAALAARFGADVRDAAGAIRRDVLAERAFATPAAIEALNAIVQPRILDRFWEKRAALEAAGATAVVVEYPLYPQFQALYVAPGDLIVAVTAPYEERVARAVAAGFDEADVRRRIAAQPTDEERCAAADVVFANDGTPAELADAVRAWWRDRGMLPIAHRVPIVHPR